MKSRLLIHSLFLTIGLLASSLSAQDEPYTVHDTFPVILNGPFLVAPAETEVTVVWRTDTPCHSKVLYGTGQELDLVAEPNEHGLVPVGTLHSVRLSGLSPGRTYSYRVSSTRVVKLKPYWSEKGRTLESPVYSFRTMDRSQGKVTFSFITDTQHEDVGRLRRHLSGLERDRIEFLVHGGDALDFVQSEEQLFDKWLEPVSQFLQQGIPLVFARGNHDMRGPFARLLYPYVATGTGRYYYPFDAGSVHFLVLDTGEDKPDGTNVYADLNRFRQYREEELSWLRSHVAESERLEQAPFRVMLMHAPSWGWVGEQEQAWTEVANAAGIDLVIAGHLHRFLRSDPGTDGNDFTILVVGQDQVATVEATSQELSVVVKDEKGETVDSFTLTPR